MRGVASSSTHCGRKPSRQVPSEKNDEYCALCSSAAAAVAIGQLQLQLSHYSLVVFQAFCFPKCDFWGGLKGASKKNFLGSLAIFSGPLKNYAIFRPLVWTQKLMHNHTYRCVQACKTRSYTPIRLGHVYRLQDQLLNRSFHMLTLICAAYISANLWMCLF